MGGENGDLGFSRKPTFTQHSIAGGVSGAFARFCINPLDVVKIHQQLRNKGIWQIAREIWQKEGYRGFYKGTVAGSCLFFVYGSVQFPVYYSLKRVMESLSLPKTVDYIASGCIAGGIASTVSCPFDLLRTKFVGQGSTKVHTSLFGTISQIARDEGPKGFFRGLRPALHGIVPQTGSFFLIFELCQSKLHDKSLPYGTGDAAAGIIAGMLSKTLVFPIDLIKRRLQVQGPKREAYAGGTVPRYEGSTLATGRAILAKEGITGLYRGLMIALMKNSPTSAVYMWGYGIASQYLVTHGIAKYHLPWELDNSL